MTQRTILLADDDKDFLSLLSRRCEGLGLEVVAVEDALTALSTADFFPPSLACFDINMPSGNGLAACEMMKDDERLASVPVIILTGRKDDETIRRCHELGAYYVVKSITVWEDLARLIGEILAQFNDDAEPPADAARVSAAERDGEDSHAAAGLATDREGCLPCSGFERDEPGSIPSPQPVAGEEAPSDAPWVLCIDDDADFARSLKLRLEAEGLAVACGSEGTEGYRQAFTHPAEAIILDYQMPNGQGDYVLRRLKESPVTKDVPVIVLTGQRDRTVERRMLSLGADRFLYKPVDFKHLLDELSAVRSRRRLQLSRRAAVS